MNRYFKFLLFFVIACILSFFTFESVNALTNYDTTFSFEIPVDEDIEENFTSDMNYDEFLNYLIDHDSDYFYYVVVKNRNANAMEIKMIPKNRYSSHNFTFYAQASSSNTSSAYLTMYFDSYMSNINYYYFLQDSNVSSNNRDGVSDFKNCFYNNICPTADYYGTSYQFRYHKNFASNQIFGRTDMNNLFSISNDTSYNLLDYGFTNSIYFYKLNFPFIYTKPTNNNTRDFYKNIVINGQELQLGENMLTYYDLYKTSTKPTFVGYSTSLKTFYTNLEPIDISNYNLKIDFKVPQSLLGYSQEPQEYVDNVKFNYYCSGRINNSNYYIYEKFNCSLTNSYSLTESNVSFTFNNINTSKDLTNYDKIYVTIDSNYLDPNINKIIYDLSYTYSLDSFYNTDFKGTIYEDFNNLPLNFKLYLSSNNNLSNSKLYVRNSTLYNYGMKFAGFSNVTEQQNLVVGKSVLGKYAPSSQDIDSSSSEFLETDVTNSIDTGIMIYQENSLVQLPKLELFFNSGIVLSFNNTDSNSFYFIDKEGNIQTGNFQKPINGDSTNNYDISYYIGVVNDFIDDLSDDTIQFSVLTQNFYNGLPIFFRTFIFVVFVLFCIYFTYLLIKR